MAFKPKGFYFPKNHVIWGLRENKDPSEIILSHCEMGTTKEMEKN